MTGLKIKPGGNQQPRASNVALCPLSKKSYARFWFSLDFQIHKKYFWFLIQRLKVIVQPKGHKMVDTDYFSAWISGTGRVEFSAAWRLRRSAVYITKTFSSTLYLLCHREKQFTVLYSARRSSNQLQISVPSLNH